MKIVLTFILLFSTLISFAQEKQEQKKSEYKLSATLKKVKSQLKEKKYSDANNTVNKETKEHEEARLSAQLYSLQTNALYNLVLEENKKMYLKQKPDTVKYFDQIRLLYTSALICDSLDAIPGKDGKVDLKYRKTNQQYLVQFRKNLATADKYFYQKKDYKKAYEYADLYLSTRKCPIFKTGKGVNLLETENDSLIHSSLAVFLAYSYNNYEGVAKYLHVALKDTAKLVQLLEAGIKSYYALGDTLSANVLLYKGVNEFPQKDFFYMSLVKYYNEKGRYQEALSVAQQVLKVMPEDRNCRYILAKEYEYLGNLDNANDELLKIIKNGDDKEVYSALGSINLQRAHKAYDSFNLKVTDSAYTKGREQIRQYYRYAKDAFEKYRKLDEKNTSIWLAGLRECYYKLNMGKELKALEKFE